jgi:hypothetical protein
VLTWVRPSYETAGGLLHRPALFNIAVMLAAVATLLAWYLLLRRRVGPVALAIGGVTWHVLLGVVCAAYAPGASFLFTVPALMAALGAGVALLVRHPLWSVVALAAGLVVGSGLLPYFAYEVFGAVGLSLAGVGAVFTVLFGLLLLPAVELLLPENPVRRRTASAIPVTALVAGVALVAAGLAADSPDGTRPAPTHLAYVLNADTGKATWVSGEPAPNDWTASYVDSRNTDDLPEGYQRGPLWTGPAQAIDAEGPEVTDIVKEGDSVTFHVRSRRDAPSVTLRLNAPMTEATAQLADGTRVRTTVTGTRKNTWPAELRFRDLPEEGATITITTTSTRLTAIDETQGLPDLPDTIPRPDTTTASTREDGDVTAVARTYPL